MTKIQYRLGLLVGVVLLTGLILTPEPVFAQWPPFSFNLLSSYEDDRITYHVLFNDQVDWKLADVDIKIPLPEGTRFIEANAIPTIDASFDGVEVTFFISTLNRKVEIGDASFVVEITDPTKTVFTTQPWIKWQGDQPGDYLAKQFHVDRTRQPLNWEEPATSRLQLEVSATVVDETITYSIYPSNIGDRMWDVQINVPLPVGTIFLSAEAPPAFAVNFNGQEVFFSTLELQRRVKIDPLTIKVSAGGVTTPVVSTYVWATWKNASRKVGREIVSQEETRTSDIIVQPQVSQRVLVDNTGDVPFSSYDLTNVALQEVALGEDGLALKVMLHTVGTIGPVGDQLEYLFYIDNDCQIDTGKREDHVGAEFRVRYRHEDGRSDLKRWDEASEEWQTVGRIRATNPAGGKMVTAWVPHELLENGQKFCWLAEAKNRTTAFNSHLPADDVPSRRDADARLTLYEAVGTVIEDIEAEVNTFVPEPFVGTLIEVGDTWQYWPGWSEPPATWKTIGFDDTGWFSGAARIGYGDGKFATDLKEVTYSAQSDSSLNLVEQVDKQSGMILAGLPSGADGTSLYMRRVFTVTKPATLTQLTLDVEYEGGFVAYLNGVEVARRGLGTAGSPLAYDTFAANYKPDSSEVIDLSDYISDLLAGTNVLAIQVHRSINSFALSIIPRLSFDSNPADIVRPANSDVMVTAPPSALPPSLSVANIDGKLAVPLDNGRVTYDVHVFSLPEGQEIMTIFNARQPNFRFDGQRLLINREGGGQENVFEYNFADGTERQVSDAPRDAHPFYDAWGNRVVYGNAELTVGAGYFRQNPDNYVNRYPYIFVQCGLLPPHLETEQRCQDIPRFGILVPAGQTGEIRGSHPVWTTNDMIVYNGCNSWAGFGACGIYIVPSSSTKGFSDGFIPRQLTQDTSDIPSDSKGDLIAFTSHRDGNWEAYVMDLNGAGVRNLSNSQASNDGLPTISPDGNWVAFVSDRSGQWAVWAVPVVGGPGKKLFDLPVDIPWGDGDRTWTNERISWGP